MSLRGWLAALSEEERQEIVAADPEALDQWDEQWGDRMNEIVMIGIGMNRPDLEEELDECLLNDNEMDMDWSSFENPLPLPT